MNKKIKTLPKKIKKVMAKVKREWHPSFIDYMKFIVNHKNYSDIPEPLNKDGNIRWVVTGGSEIGRLRDKWWLNQVKSLNTSNKAEVARLIHPKELKGLKPCQICGKELYIDYVYPNANTIKKIKKIFNTDYLPFDKTILQIIDEQYLVHGNSTFEMIKILFNIKEDLKNDIGEYKKFVLTNRLSKLSPGAMCNPPDRFDGFHTYNACCRGTSDIARHKSNMATYNQDRRAYEYWSEGNFNISNRLMGEYRKDKNLYKCPKCGKMKKMTADHIGPISLGFIQRPYFNPLCQPCNSGKNNRLTFTDVQQLISEEMKEPVVSWHSKYIWDLLKNKVENDEDAIKLSRIMVTNLQNVLQILSDIYINTGEDFLKIYLKPEYAFVDYRFENFNPMDLSTLLTVDTPLDSKNKQKNSERYIRVSFETLSEFQKKENRRVKGYNNTEVDNILPEIFNFIVNNEFDKADTSLKKAINILAIQALNNW